MTIAGKHVYIFQRDSENRETISQRLLNQQMRRFNFKARPIYFCENELDYKLVCQLHVRSRKWSFFEFANFHLRVKLTFGHSYSNEQLIKKGFEGRGIPNVHK
ncbi:unnamed protein product [Allacma fusca]|uniref:Uncharacterized protein n=1 Tax=Allacma fusca TaxID=39272 RepID=A0A8J2P2G1_9HEXA|nr:unnamed protein product [Allacma fusca]